MNKPKSRAGLKPSKQRDKAASKQKLMEAGLHVFSERGYEGATTRAIAQQAGLNEQLLTRYFGGKAGLLAEIYVDFLRGQQDDGEYRKKPLGGTPGGEIEQFLRYKHAHFVETEKYLRIVLPELIFDPSLRARLDHSIMHRSAKILGERLTHFVGRGQLRPEVDIEALSLIVLCQSLAMSFLLRTIEGVGDEDILNHLSRFAATVARGIEQA